MKTEISWWKEIRLTRKRTDRLYYRLADELASLIENSRIPAGTILPSTLQLSRLLESTGRPSGMPMRNCSNDTLS